MDKRIFEVEKVDYRDGYFMTVGVDYVHPSELGTKRLIRVLRPFKPSVTDPRIGWKTAKAHEFLCYLAALGFNRCTNGKIVNLPLRKDILIGYRILFEERGSDDPIQIYVETDKEHIRYRTVNVPSEFDRICFKYDGQLDKITVLFKHFNDIDLESKVFYVKINRGLQEPIWTFFDTQGGCSDKVDELSCCYPGLVKNVIINDVVHYSITMPDFFKLSRYGSVVGIRYSVGLSEYSPCVYRFFRSY